MLGLPPTPTTIILDALKMDLRYRVILSADILLKHFLSL
jgi:hypothetical protein